MAQPCCHAWRQTAVQAVTCTNDAIPIALNGADQQCNTVLQLPCSSAHVDQQALLAAPVMQQHHQEHVNTTNHSSTAPSISTSSQQQPLQAYASLLQQLDAVGWSRITNVSRDLRTVNVQLQDASNRLHTAVVQLPSGFPVSAPSVTVQLPKPWKPKWLPGHNLAQLMAQLEHVLDGYQPLWEQLEDIDSHTQLLDPAAALAHPYATCSRCIALGNGGSFQLQLSPAAPRALPSAVTFHGPSIVVAGLQANWYGGAHQVWDEQRSVRQNVEAVLQLRLPAPKPGSRKGCAAVLAAAHQGGQDAADAAAGGFTEDAVGMSDSDDDEGDAGACAICYSLHLPDPARPDKLGDAPSVSCPGASCSRVYHALCLAEWLGALPTSRRVFDTMFGSCPFCNSPIGVSTRPAAQA